MLKQRLYKIYVFIITHINYINTRSPSVLLWQITNDPEIVENHLRSTTNYPTISGIETDISLDFEGIISDFVFERSARIVLR